MFHNLVILNWNAHSLRYKMPELTNFICEYNIDVACITETHLDPHITLEDLHPEFIVYRRDRLARSGGGVAIMIKKSIAHTELPNFNFSLVEGAGLELTLKDNRKIQLFVLYLPPTTTTLTRTHFIKDLRMITSRFRRGNFFIVGDFNSKHADWGCDKPNTAGRLLYDEVLLDQLRILYPQEATHVPDDPRKTPSTIDLTVTNACFATGQPICRHIGSDHNGVIIEVQLQPSKIPQKFHHIYNYAEANWVKYQSWLNSKFNTDAHNTNIDTVEEIERLVELFTTATLTARDYSVPIVLRQGRKLLELDDFTKQLIDSRRWVRKQWQRSRQVIFKEHCNQLTRLIRDRINVLKNVEYERRVNPYGQPDGSGLWKLVGTFKPPKDPIPVLVDNGISVYSTKDKVELLSKQFFENHCNPLVDNNPPFTQTVHSEVEEFLQLPLSIEENILPPSIDEVKNIIKSSKNRKSPGNDNVKNILLKNLPPIGFAVLTTIISMCLRLSYFPSSWKLAKVIAIRKPNKPKSLAINYRPISLLSNISKILERIVLYRLNFHIEDHNLIPTEQHGFRLGKSTKTQLVKVIGDLHRNLVTGNTTGMLLLDAEKAFERIWHRGLLYKMIKMNFPRRIIKLVESFLSGRKFEVALSGKRSNIRGLPFGVPQGAVLSPVLYNLFVSDAPICPACAVAFYADDCALYHMTSKWTDTLDIIETKLAEFHSFFERWKISLNIDKTQAVIVTRRTKHELPDAPLVFQGSTIQWKRHGVYLGLEIDSRLTMGGHITDKIRKTDKLFRMLYPLIGRRSRLNVRLKLLIYKSYIRPVFTYAAPVLVNISRCHIVKLQMLQNRILKSILNVPWDTCTAFIHSVCNIEMVSEYLYKLSL